MTSPVQKETEHPSNSHSRAAAASARHQGNQHIAKRSRTNVSMLHLCLNTTLDAYFVSEKSCFSCVFK